MVHSIEIEVALLWSIKKETFMENVNEGLSSESNKTAIPGYNYSFWIEEKDGYIAICFEESKKNAKIKEMTLTIPSANFKTDLSKKADVPEDHDFYGRIATVALKSEDILNPEKNFFVNNILTMEFRGVFECNEKPNTKSLGEMLWDAEEDMDFTFIFFGKREIKAHKFILRQYSSVFTEMFDSNINQMKINNFSHFVFWSVLRCLYEVPGSYFSADLSLECLRFADVFNMPVFKERISNKMAKFITAKNVCKFANKSVEYNAPTLKGYCINFILKCKRDGKQYDDALNLNIEIVHELYKSSLLRTETS